MALPPVARSAAAGTGRDPRLQAVHALPPEPGASAEPEAEEAGGGSASPRVVGAVKLGLYPIVTFQYSSTNVYQVSYNIQ